MARVPRGIRRVVSLPKARGSVRVGKECLELDVLAPDELSHLRAWVGQVNGPAFAQPYLVEGPPGRFRLYVGEAAERARTALGIL